MEKYIVRNKADLLLDVVDVAEWQSVLLSHFSQGTLISEKTIRYGVEDGGQFLLVTYSNANKVSKIEDNLSKEAFAGLKQAIKEALIDEQVVRVANLIAFCDSDINGYYQYRNLFQIIPIPEGNAKMPSYTMAEYPFLLQYKYVSSKNVTVSHVRRQQLERKYLNLLSFVLMHRVKTNRPAFGSWGFQPFEEPLRAAWFQHGYVLAQPVAEATDFEVIPRPLEFIPHEEFYADKGRSVGEPLKLPASLTGYLDTIFQLREDHKKKFFAAISTINMAMSIWNDSQSASFISLTTALEGLLPESKIYCEICKQPVFSIAKRFKSFIEKYAPWEAENKKALELLYSTRSQLAHGSLVFESDIDYSGHLSFDLISHNQDHTWRRMRWIALSVVINWMIDPNKD